MFREVSHSSSHVQTTDISTTTAEGTSGLGFQLLDVQKWQITIWGFLRMREPKIIINGLMTWMIWGYPPFYGKQCFSKSWRMEWCVPDFQTSDSDDVSCSHQNIMYLYCTSKKYAQWTYVLLRIAISYLAFKIGFEVRFLAHDFFVKMGCDKNWMDEAVPMASNFDSCPLDVMMCAALRNCEAGGKRNQFG